MAETAGEKLYYRIGEVAEILKVNTSVLRFWETQFAVLAPRKTRTGQRLYSSSELDLLKEIKNLLYVEKLTIVGAIARLSTIGKRMKQSELPQEDLLGTVRQELKELRKLLD
jgi:DNA-binding transcriptional MerR regulator